MTHSLFAPVPGLGATGHPYSAIGSVLGGATNAIVAGLVAETLVAVAAWQIGSVAGRRRRSAASHEVS